MLFTYALIGLCVIFSVMGFTNPSTFHKYMFYPYAIKRHKEYYRFLSHAFLHADTIHLAMNMFVLYIFGQTLEGYYFEAFFGKQMGTLYYILLYTGGIYASSITDYFRNKDNPNYTSIGASGAVNAIVFSYILINPMSKMGLIFIPFLRLPAFAFGFLFLLYSWYMNKRGGDRVAHGAHFWGAIFGIVFTAAIKPELVTRLINLIPH